MKLKFSSPPNLQDPLTLDIDDDLPEITAVEPSRRKKSSQAPSRRRSLVEISDNESDNEVQITDSYKTSAKKRKSDDAYGLNYEVNEYG